MRDRLADRPNFVSGLAAASGGRFVPVPGGVLIRLDDMNGPIIGAVGVSGDTSDKDEYRAILGVGPPNFCLSLPSRSRPGETLALTH